MLGGGADELGAAEPGFRSQRQNAGAVAHPRAVVGARVFLARLLDELLAGGGEDLRGARTIAIDDKTHKIYVPTATVAPTQTAGGHHRISEAEIDRLLTRREPDRPAARRAVVDVLEQMGFEIEAAHHEVAHGQHEIDFRYADAVTTADNLATFRFVVRDVAQRFGLHASFMPKPIFGQNGSGMHTHQSLFSGDRNAFFEGGAEYQLSRTGRSFIAGLLRHAPEITAVTNQWVNSYKRLAGGGEAPAYVCWGHNNRSALVRVPMYKPQKGQSTRVEYRGLDAATNPYLAYALLLEAGLKGVAEGYELPAGADDDVWALSDAERRVLGIDPLPASLKDAIDVMEGSELVAQTLGEHVFDVFLRNKRAEFDAYRSQVTQWELDTGLPVL